MFDPLAVMLVVAFNQALLLRDEEDEHFAKRKATGTESAKKSWWEMYNETKEKILQRESIEKEKTQDEHWRAIYNEPLGDEDTTKDDDSDIDKEERNPLRGGVKT